MKGSRKTHFDFDVAVIGGGSGGYAAARTAANSGLKTVVIEGGEEVGGLCILRGCMPTKALLYASDVFHLVKAARTWGIHAPKPGFHFAEVMARKDAMIRDFADYRHEQLRSGKFKFIRSRAHFVDPHTVALSNGEKITARNFVLSTGSTIGPSPVPHLKEVGCLTSDTALALKKLPKSLIVLGGGPVAVEFAQFFARFEVKVTLIQRSEHLLRDFDPDASAEIEKVLRREGIKILSCTKLINAFRRSSRKGIRLSLEGSGPCAERKKQHFAESSPKDMVPHHRDEIEVIAEEILFALGRVPNTAGLALEKAGIKSEFGRISTNAEMQTSARHIYAAGDCAGPYEIVHIAIQQGEIAAHNIAHPNRKKSIDYRLLTSVVFTDPQVASVGLTEKQSIERGVPYMAASYPFADHGKSLIMEAKDGFVKLLADPGSGEIIGGSCVGPYGGELIHEIIAAMANRMTVQELAAMPHYHPTLAEIWTYPAEELAEKIGQ